MPTSAPLVSWRGETARTNLPARVLYRYFVSGQALRGPGDNATLLHAASVDYRARPYITLTGPIWQRLARRNGAITVPVLLTAAAPVTPISLWMVATYEGALLLAAFAYACIRARRRLRDGRRNREWIDPAAHRLCNIIKHRYIRKHARRLIALPREWGADHDGQMRLVATIYMPEGTVLTKSSKQSITENVGAALGIPAPVDADWAVDGSRVELSAAPLPPATVTWEDIREAALACKDDEVIVGRKNAGHFVTISLSEDSPHVAMSGAAGSGKSVLVRVVLMQRLMRGDGVAIFDPKRFSHMRWANEFGRDRVIYAVTAEQLHEGWMAVGQEMRRRIGLPLDALEGQRRVWLVAEEINAQVKILTRYWKEKRQEMMRPARALLADCEKECGGSKQEGLALAEERDPDIMAKLDPPAISPAIAAMQEGVFMGRELRMHVIAAAQRLSAGVFGGGGGDVRESFQGGRFMAKWDRKLWKMLADGIPYVAWPGGKRGVWGLARGDEFEIFRVPMLEEAEMSNVLSSGAPVHGPVLGPQREYGTVDSSASRTAITSGVKLSDAVGQLPAGRDGQSRTLDSLRRASSRPGFPPSIGLDGTAKLYDLDSLVAWAQA